MTKNNKKKATRKKHPQDHLFPILSTMFVAGLLALMASARIQYSRPVIIAACISYVVANSHYGYRQGTFTLTRFLEFCLSALLVAYVALTFIQ